MQKLLNEIVKILWIKKPYKNKSLVKFLEHNLQLKNVGLLKDKNNFKKIISSLSSTDLIFLAFVEKIYLGIEPNDKFYINMNYVTRYIKDNKMNVAYSIQTKKYIYYNDDKSIYGIQSVGKILTGFLIILFLSKGIIKEEELNSPIKLSSNITKLLPKNIINRLSKTTFLDLMLHQSGIKDYMEKYKESIKYALINNKSIPNPINPEDFLEYADTDVTDLPYYSNLSFVLIALSAEYHYNKYYNKNKTYNEILKKFILTPAHVKEFYIKAPPDAKVNIGDEIPAYYNGSPAGNYWTSAENLRKIGEWIKNKCIHNNEIYQFVKKYGKEFYYEKQDLIQHMGTNASEKNMPPTASSYLGIFLNDEVILSITSNHDNDANNLHKEMFFYDLYKKYIKKNKKKSY